MTWGKIATDTGIVDIGYHHNRVDYLVDDMDTVVSNGALTINPGTVLGIHGQDRAIWAEWYGRIIANGNLYTGDSPLISSKRCISMGIESAHKDASVCPGGNPNDGQIGLLLYDDSGFSSQVLGVTFRGLYVGVSSNMSTPEPIANNRLLACFLGVDVWDWFGDGLPYGRWYIDQDCGAVDAGSVAACTSALNPYTTATDGRYDKLMADVGFHYPNPDGPQNPSPTAPMISIQSPAPYQLVTGDCLVQVNVEDALGPTPGIDRVEFYVDYQPIGMLSEGRPRHTWQSHEHGNGTHVVQAVAIDFDGEVAASAPVTVETDNLVHSFRISRQDVENFGGGSGPTYFEGLVEPGAAWSAYVLDEDGAPVRNLGSGTSGGFSGAWYGEKDGGQAVDGGLYTLEVEASEQCFSHVCCVNDVPWDECMLLIFAPIADNEYDKELVQPVIDCARARLIPYRVHYGQSANWYWLSKILKPDDTTACQYFYMSCHGNGRFKEYDRARFWLSDGPVISDCSGFQPEEWSGFCLADLGLGSSTKMKFVWIDACECGIPDPSDPDNNDMARQFGIRTEHWTPDYDQCYLGFDAVIPEPSDPHGFMDRQYTKSFWDRLAVNYYVNQAYENICLFEPELWYMTWHSRPDHGQYICPHAVVLPMHP